LADSVGKQGDLMDVRTTAAIAAALVVLANGPALAQAYQSWTGSSKNAIRPPLPIGSDPYVTGSIDPKPHAQSLPAEVRPESIHSAGELPPHFRRQLVDYRTSEPAGSIVIDTANTYLYLVLGTDRAIRYGIGVGREGFTWVGIERISRMAEWPDWNPPSEMIDREPHLPRFMAGGEGNPLGARALYLGKTVFRIHGTNQPSTIGTFVSSGCIRLINEDIIDLYARVQVGARVVVLRGQPFRNAPAARQDLSVRTPLVPPAEVPFTPAHSAVHR
jgi:lipoprotein-anchoring transpeptidase ErfK/SrfK